jgi:hypothetical protein
MILSALSGTFVLPANGTKAFPSHSLLFASVLEEEMEKLLFNYSRLGKKVLIDRSAVYLNLNFKIVLSQLVSQKRYKNK